MLSRRRGGEAAAEAQRSEGGWQRPRGSPLLPLRAPRSPLLPPPWIPALLVPPSTPWRRSRWRKPTAPALRPFGSMAAILPLCGAATLGKPVASVEGRKQAPCEADCSGWPVLASPESKGVRDHLEWRLACTSGFPSICATMTSDWEGLYTMNTLRGSYNSGRMVAQRITAR